MGEISRAEQSTQQYKDWRAAVYKRDKHKCVCCKKRSYLNAHHLNGWSWSVCERYTVSNGVTLCWKCHRDFHKEYGHSNNTIFQFMMFLGKYGRTIEDLDLYGV